MTINLKLTNPKVEFLPRKELEKLQLKKLRYMVNLAYQTSPYYHRVFKKHGLKPSDIQSLKDLTKIPITKREDLMDSPKDFILQPKKEQLTKILPKKKLISLLLTKMVNEEKAEVEVLREFYPVRVTFTSGRSGNPVPVFYTHYDLDLFSDIAGRGAIISGSKTGMIGLNLFPRVVDHLAGFQAVFAFQSIFAIPVSISMMTERSIRAAEALEVQGIAGIPSYIMYWFRRAAEMGVKLPKIQVLFVAGERVSKGWREKLMKYAEELGVEDLKIREGYGLTEAKHAMLECELDSGFHTFPDIAIWEVVDEETFEPVGEGERGAILFTHIDYRGTIFLRYLTGDIAEGGMTYEKCPHCGRTVSRIHRPIGRMMDYLRELHITKVKGTTVNLNAITDVIEENGNVKDYQIVITKEDPSDPYSRDVLIVRIECHSPNEYEKTAREIVEAVRSVSEVTPLVEHVEGLSEMLVSDIKAHRVVDKRPVEA